MTGGRLVSATPDPAFHEIFNPVSYTSLFTCRILYLILFRTLIKQRETKDKSTATLKDRGKNRLKKKTLMVGE